MYKVKIENFSGPLDLLLQLIEKQELEITEVSIGQVTDQYLEHIEGIEDIDPEELSDFLVIASRLLLLKSKALLPFLEEEEELDDLEKQLKMYKEFIEASKQIQAMINKKRFTYAKEKMPIKSEIEFSPPENVNLTLLRDTFLVILKRLDPLVKLPRQAMAKTISLQQRIFEIRDFLKKENKVGFKNLMKNAKNRTEVIVNFLAILELLKQRQVKVKQTQIFDDITLEKI